MGLIGRRDVLRLALAAPAVLAGLPALASAPRIFQDMGAAIGGTDPCGYFLQGGPVPGSMQHAVMWRGAKWVFASDTNREMFEADPNAFAPRFGGYCAYAAARGFLAPSIPEAWTIWRGRLYLNASLPTRKIWREDIPGNVARAEANWPAILG